ncbi:MAG TPA: hypothetical protein VIL00_03820 [Pseudonocardiaceae bacterium]
MPTVPVRHAFSLFALSSALLVEVFRMLIPVGRHARLPHLSALLSMGAGLVAAGVSVLPSRR